MPIVSLEQSQRAIAKLFFLSIVIKISSHRDDLRLRTLLDTTITILSITACSLSSAPRGRRKYDLYEFMRELKKAVHSRPMARWGKAGIV